jgi:opacity protein-like surface antigen
MGTGIVGRLIVLIALPLSAGASDFKLLFSLGANLRYAPGYSYDYALLVNRGNALHAAEYGRGKDRVDKAQILGLDLGLGLAYQNVSLMLSFVPFNGNLAGTYDLSIPSMWFYNLVAADSIKASSKFSGTSFGADLRYALPLRRDLHVYGEAGVRFLSADLELPQDIVFMEYFNRSPDFSFSSHTLDITEVKFTPVAVRSFGGAAAAGVEFTPASHYWIFLEGRYQFLGKKDIPHPYYSRLDVTAAPVHLDFSGFALTLGIRYALEW